MRKIGVFIAWVCMLALVSCGSNDKDMAPTLLIDAEQLPTVCSEFDTTYVVLWASWCKGSLSTCENTFEPLADALQRYPNNNGVVFIGIDSEVTPEAVKAKAGEKARSFRLKKSHAAALLNRWQVKTFLSDAFPERELKTTEGLLFSIPVKLMVTPDGMVTDDYEGIYKAIQHAERQP